MSRIPAFPRRCPLWLWVFLAAFMVQFALLISISGTNYFLPDSDDMKFYNDWARRIAAGQWSDGKAFYGMPGFAYALAAIYSVTGYEHEFSPFLIGQLNAVFHALTATFIFLIGRRTFGTDKSGTAISIIASAVWVVLTPAQVFSAILMPTSWVICGYWGATLFMLRAAHSEHPQRKSTWLCAGLVTGLVACTVATIFMLLPLMLVCIAVTSGRSEKRVVALLASLAGAFAVSSGFSAAFDFSITRLAVAIAAVALVGTLVWKRRALLPIAASAALLLAGVYAATSPVWLHNRFVAKDTVFLSAHDGLNLYVGNHSEANGYTKIPTSMSSSQAGMLRDSELIPQAENGRSMKRSEISAYWRTKARAYMSEHTGDWLKLLAVKFSNFWNVYQYDDLSIIKLLRDEGVVPPGLRFGFIAALGLAGLPFCWMRWKSSRWIIGAVCLHVASLMPVFITERYRLAAAPGLILLGVGGLAILWKSIERKAWSSVLVSVVALVCAAWFCTLSRADAGWALDFYKAGIRATQASLLTKDPATANVALDRAQKNLEIAYAYADQNADVVFALGNLWLEKHDVPRAEACYKQAFALSIAANPKRGHDAALSNLGVLAAHRREWADAERYFTTSLSFDPVDAKIWVFLGETLSQLGNTAASANAFSKAQSLKLDGTQIEKLREKLRTGKF